MELELEKNGISTGYQIAYSQLKHLTAKPGKAWEAGAHAGSRGHVQSLLIPFPLSLEVWILWVKSSSSTWVLQGPNIKTNA